MPTLQEMTDQGVTLPPQLQMSGSDTVPQGTDSATAQVPQMTASDTPPQPEQASAQITPNVWQPGNLPPGFGQANINALPHFPNPLPTAPPQRQPVGLPQPIPPTPKQPSAPPAPPIQWNAAAMSNYVNPAMPWWFRR